MFKPDAGLGLRVVRTVFIPSGPLIVVVVLGSAGAFSDPVAQGLILVSMAWFFCALILVPALLFRPGASPDSFGEEGGGGNDGPQEPPSHGPGLGRIPLPDAEQSRERVRDHMRRKRRWLQRRAAREPEQEPSRL